MKSPLMDEVYERMKEQFHSSLPDSLYMHPAELKDVFGGSEQAWEDFLDLPETKIFIDAKVAKNIEIESRKALKKLSNGSFAQGEVQGLKELLAKSKTLQEKANQRPKVILTYLPKRQTEQKGENEDEPNN